VAVVQYTFTHKQYIEQHNENRMYRKEHTLQQEYINVTIIALKYNNKNT